MIVDLTIHVWDAHKVDKAVTREVLLKHNAVKDAGRFSKKLLNDDATKPIAASAATIRAFHTKLSSPWRNDGARILSTAHLDEYITGLRERKQAFDALADDFAIQYPRHINEARITHKGLFNQGDYPDPSVIRQKFGIETTWLPMPESTDFRLSIGDEVLADMQASMERAKEQAVQLARNDIYKRLAEKLQVVSQQLGNEERKVYDSTFTNLAEVCRLIPGLNITQDPEIEKLRVICLEHVVKFKPEEIRNNPDKRRHTANAADEILKAMGLL